MKGKVGRLLIAVENMKFANQLLWKVRETLPEPLKILKETKIKTSSEIIARGQIDIFIIGTKLDGDGEELISFIRKFYPEHPVIVLLKDEDIRYQLRLYKKYKNIDCLTEDELFDGLTEPLLKAHTKMLEYNSRRINFSNEIIMISDICYITPAGGNMIYLAFYDYKKKELRFLSRKMTMTGFMKAYNRTGNFIRCHGSWIVNKMMVDKIDKTGYLVLMVKSNKGEEILIPISDTYRKDVLEQLKGMF